MKFKCISDEPNTNEMKMLTVGKIYDGKFTTPIFLHGKTVFIRECDDGISGEFQEKYFEVVEDDETSIS